MHLCQGISPLDGDKYSNFFVKCSQKYEVSSNSFSLIGLGVEFHPRKGSECGHILSEVAGSIGEFCLHLHANNNPGTKTDTLRYG